MGSSPQQRLTAAQRRKQAFGLYLAGVDFPTIATQAGYASATAARTAIDRALAESLAREHSDIDEQRTLAVMQYNRIQAAWWGKAVAEKDPKAALILLRCMAQRDRITGVIAPTHVNIDAARLGEEILAMVNDGEDQDGDGG